MRRHNNVSITTLVETVAPLIVILSITKEVKPATSVVVAPKVNVVEPNVKVGFAKLAFVIPALPDKFEFVIRSCYSYLIVCNCCVNT